MRMHKSAFTKVDPHQTASEMERRLKQGFTQNPQISPNRPIVSNPVPTAMALLGKRPSTEILEPKSPFQKKIFFSSMTSNTQGEYLKPDLLKPHDHHHLSGSKSAFVSSL
jgi:hypothetical protein